MSRAVERLKSGRYKVRYRHANKETSQTFDKAGEAKRFTQLLAVFPKDPQRALDALDEEAGVEAPVTLNQVAADHIELLTGIESGTRLTYTRLWARTWGPLIGQLPAAQLGRDDVARATNVLAETYSAKSLKNQRGLLAAVCDRAVDLRLLHVNPTKRLRLPRAREVERVEMRILTPAEFAGLIPLVHEHYRPLVRFLAGTGCRWGEAVALQVSDVVLPNVRIRRGLKWSPDNNRTIGPTKTKKSNRTVALGRELQADLERLVDGRPGDALVFTAPRGGPIQHRTFWSDVWLPAVRHLTPRPRIHDLRHSHVAFLLAQGIPIHIVQRRLGHESITTTVDTYGGLLPDAQAAAAAAADLAFGGAPELT